jgi:acetyltransferase-like isoleucine patch superfamily enzyme
MKVREQSYRAKIIAALRSRGFVGSFKHAWIRFWMVFAGTGPAGRLATWLVTWFAPTHYDRQELRFLNSKGFVAPSATLHGKDIHLGPNIFIDDGTLICQSGNGGSIDIGARVTVSRNTIIQTALGGSVTVGEKTVLQPYCFLSAAQGSIQIGADVGIGPYCAFYPHDHGTVAGQSIMSQPPVVKGDIVVEDGVWLGHGVTVLSGVRIGKGAVIGAGSTVAGDVPDEAVAWGVPAKVFMKRKNPPEISTVKESPVSRGNKNTGEGSY